MKRTSGQFPTCDNCGREIRANAMKVPTRQGAVQMFHPDAHACASAPETRPAKTLSKEGAMHTPNYSIADAVNLGYEGGSGKGN